MKTISVVSILISLIGFPTDTLTGKWASKPSAAGNVTSVLFKQDNTFEGYVNRKPFTSGKYKLEDGVFSFTDNGCNGVPGTYRVIFFADADSLRFEPISDDCTDRKEGMKKLVMGKVK